MRQILLTSSALLVVSLLVPHAAQAQSQPQTMSVAEKIQLLERQTELLQKQLKELKEDQVTRVKTVKKTTAEADTQKNEQVAKKASAEDDTQKNEQAGKKASAEADTQKSEHADQKTSEEEDSILAYAKDPIKRFIKAAPEKVKLTVGGFIAAETVWRQRNEVSDIGSSFTGIPYPFSPLFNEHEFHGTARQSRISLLVEGDIDPFQKLSGYYETDFLGVGNTSNYNQSNSWAPRLRHAYFTYDNNVPYGFHFLAGQTWSLLTQNQVGITPRKENIPLTVDANYVVGFNYTRSWQIRAVQSFGSWLSAGVSVEAPATIFGGSVTTAPLGTGGAFTSGSTIVNGTVVNFNNPGNSFLTGTTIATDQNPDIIEKLALDPGWGHYEVFGMQRWFTDNTLNCITGLCIAGSTVMTGYAGTKTAFGSGVGGSVLLPLIPKYLEFTGNVMYGKGVGRYGAGQLPDVTISVDGALTPLTELTAMVGLIAHIWEGTDIYGYAGMERVNAGFFDIGTTFYGYGNPGFSNVGCQITTPSSFAGTTPANCIANNRLLQDLTVGFWQNLYKGQYGRVAAGAQYEYIKRKSFDGLGGAPSTYDHVAFTSLRYYPF